MKAIVLTEFGETLLIPKDCSDETKLNTSGLTPVGRHEADGASLYIGSTSQNYNVLSCKVCCMRIVLLKSIDTYGKLRKSCAVNIKSKRRTMSDADIESVITKNGLMQY